MMLSILSLPSSMLLTYPWYFSLSYSFLSASLKSLAW